MKNMMSLDNGHTWMTAAEAMAEINDRNLWDAVVNMMDDVTREAVCNDLVPCAGGVTEEEFLAEYLRRAADGLIIG